MNTGTFRIGKYVGFGQFDNWEVYSLDHAPTDLDWCTIAEALKYQNPDLTFDEKSCEKINFLSKFKDMNEAVEFENQVLSAALDAVDDESKKFIIAGINGEVISGYYSWLVSQMTHDHIED